MSHRYIFNLFLNKLSFGHYRYHIWIRKWHLYGNTNKLLLLLVVVCLHQQTPAIDRLHLVDRCCTCIKMLKILKKTLPVRFSSEQVSWSVAM